MKNDLRKIFKKFSKKNFKKIFKKISKNFQKFSNTRHVLVYTNKIYYIDLHD